MEAQSGEVDIYRIEADNTLGAKTQTLQLARTWTGATIGAHGFNTYLYLLNADTGELRRHVFNSNGTGATGAGSTVSVVDSDWQDVANFDSYRVGTTLYLAGLDPWNARHRIYKGDLTYLTGSNWTRGWTDIDHVDIGGTGYMLSYKAAGDPYTLGDTSETGRLALQSIDSSGAHTVLSDSNVVGGGWTTVRFVPIPGSTAKRILFYNSVTGAYRVYAFSTGTGLGAQIGAQQTTTAGLTDIEAYATGTETFLLQLSEDSRDRLDWSEAEKFGACVHQALTTSDTATFNPVVGYQFGVIQHGRVVFRRAWGNSRLSPAAAMTTRTPVDIGSVSKMLTTMHVLKLADDGDIDLDTRISDHLDPSLYTGLNSWTNRITVRDLMRRETGVTSTGGCDGGPDLETTCLPFFTTAQDNPAGSCGGALGQCDRTAGGTSGYNASYGALREVFEYERGLSTAIDVDAEAHALWMDDLELDATTCLADTNVYYFGTAGDNCTLNGTTCVTDTNGDKRVQSRFVTPPDVWSQSCGAGGWQSSVQQLLRLLAGIQHEKVLSSGMTDQLLDMTLTAPNANSAIGWDTPSNWAGPGANQKTLAKGGDRDLNVSGFAVGTHTHISTLPDNAGVVLLINTDDGDSGSSQTNTVRAAYQYAIGQAASCVDGW